MARKRTPPPFWVGRFKGLVLGWVMSIPVSCEFLGAGLPEPGKTRKVEYSATLVVPAVGSCWIIERGTLARLAFRKFALPWVPFQTSPAIVYVMSWKIGSPPFCAPRPAALVALYRKTSGEAPTAMVAAFGTLRFVKGSFFPGSENCTGVVLLLARSEERR